MRKSIIAMLSGVVLGIIMMMGVFSLLNLKPANEEILAQNKVEQNITVDRNVAELVAEGTTDAILFLKEEMMETKELAMIVPEMIEETQMVQGNDIASKPPTSTWSLNPNGTRA